MSVKDNMDDYHENKLLDTSGFQHVEAEDILDEFSFRRNKVPIVVEQENESPKDRFWLYDTPGAINEAQVVGLLLYCSLFIVC